MSVATVRDFFLCCTLINYPILILWALLMFLPHGWLHRLCTRWYRISPEQFDTISFAGIMLYKLLIFVFNLVPYFALVIVGRG
jgi:hypothetical protein